MQRVCAFKGCTVQTEVATPQNTALIVTFPPALPCHGLSCSLTWSAYSPRIPRWSFASAMHTRPVRMLMLILAAIKLLGTFGCSKNITINLTGQINILSLGVAVTFSLGSLDMAPPGIASKWTPSVPGANFSLKIGDPVEILVNQEAGARGNALGDALATLKQVNAAEAQPVGPLANAVEVSRQLREGVLAEIPAAFKFPPHMQSNVPHDEFCGGLDIPLVDLSPVWTTFNCNDDHKAAMDKLVQDIARACETCGFFNVIGHQVPDLCVKEMQFHSRKLFDLPLEHKLKGSFAVGATSQRRGYSATPKTVTPSPALIWQEGFTLIGDKSGQVDVESYAKKIWPDDVEQCKAFSQIFQEYAGYSMQLAMVLKDLLIKALKADPAHFEQYFESPTQVVHITFYPPSPSPMEVMGLNPHYDVGLFTVIAQDDVPGLQLRGKNGKWFSIRPVPGAFFFNVADTLQALSNGRFRSNLHRVMVNKERPRLSISTFLAAAFDKTIHPAPELVDDEHPRLYRPYTCGEYMSTLRAQHLDHISNSGQLLDFVKIDSPTE